MLVGGANCKGDGLAVGGEEAVDLFGGLRHGPNVASAAFWH